MECHSVEQRKEKFIKELLEVNQKNLVKVVKHTGVVQWLIELDTLCYIHFLEGLWVMIAFSL